MSAETDLLEYMDQVIAFKGNPPNGCQYNCIEQFVRRHGRYYEWRPRPKRYRKMANGLCYANSQKLAYRRGLIYCEGYGLGIIPMLHAWCLDDQGLVVDATWQECAGYIGVSFSLEYIMKQMVRTRHHTSMIDNYLQGWPLLQGLPESEWSHDYRQTATSASSTTHA